MSLVRRFAMFSNLYQCLPLSGGSLISKSKNLHLYQCLSSPGRHSSAGRENVHLYQCLPSPSRSFISKSKNLHLYQCLSSLGAPIHLQSPKSPSLSMSPVPKWLLHQQIEKISIFINAYPAPAPIHQHVAKISILINISV